MAVAPDRVPREPSDVDDDRTPMLLTRPEEVAPVTSDNPPDMGAFFQTLDDNAPAPGMSESISLGTPIYDPEREARVRQRVQTAKAEAQAPLDQRKADLEAGYATEQKATANFKKAGTERIDAAERMEREQFAPLQAEQERLGAEYQEAIKVRDTYQAQMQSAVQDMDTYARQIAAEQPHQFWDDKSLGFRLATIALTGLGGATQALYGDKTNAAADQISAMIQRDTLMQRLKFDKNKDDYANKNTLVARMAQHFDRSERAQDAAYVTGMQGVIGRLNVMKQLMTSPQMRQNLDFQVAQLEQKSALAHQKLLEDVVGKAVGLGGKAIDAEVKLGTSNQGIQTLKAGIAAQKAAADAQAKDNLAQVPGYEFPKGFLGDPKTEGKNLRNGLATTAKVTNAMHGVIAELDRASPASLLSITNQRLYHQAVSQLIEAARGEGFGQTGSRLTAMLKELEESAFTPGALGRLTPETSKKLLLRAEKAVWENMNENVKARGGVPALKGPDHHPYFGDE